MVAGSPQTEETALTRPWSSARHACPSPLAAWPFPGMRASSRDAARARCRPARCPAVVSHDKRDALRGLPGGAYRGRFTRLLAPVRVLPIGYLKTITRVPHFHILLIYWGFPAWTPWSARVGKSRTLKRIVCAASLEPNATIIHHTDLFSASQRFAQLRNGFFPEAVIVGAYG